MAGRKSTIFAAYKGETFLIADFVDKVAEYLGTTEKNVRWMSTPAYKKRQKVDGNSTVIITFKDEF